MDLFQHNSFQNFLDGNFEFNKRKRVVTTYPCTITLNGVVFDADDLRYTLFQVIDGEDIVLDFSSKQTKVLKEMGIIDSEGSLRNCMRATIGPNGQKFFDALETLIETSPVNES